MLRHGNLVLGGSELCDVIFRGGVTFCDEV